MNEHAAVGGSDGTGRSATFDRVAALAPITLVVFGVMVISRMNAPNGHELGDDWTLYIRQAKGLAQGNVGEVIADNALTRRESSSPVFSPPVYPWGFPIILAPFIAMKGHFDVALFQKLETLMFGGFLFAWYFVVRRRVPEFVAVLLTLLIGMSPWYNEWPRQVLSEFPYLLLIAVAFWLFDRIRDRGLWDGGSWRLPLVLGIVIGYAFSTRREAIALVPALLAAHAIHLHHNGWLERSRGRLLAPYLAAGAFVAGLQLMLPSAFFKYDNAGPKNLLNMRTYYPDKAAEMLGLRDGGVYHRFGPQLLKLFLVLALAGMLVRVITHAALDAPLVVFLMADWYVVGTQPFVEERYLFVMLPIAAYFAYQAVAMATSGVAAFLRHLGAEPPAITRSLPAVIGAAALLPLVFGNVRATVEHTQNRRDYERLAPGTVMWGAEHPQWTEMFAAVKSTVRSDEIVSFFRARTMNLYADRQALQLWDLNHVMQRADWYVEQIGSDYSEAPMSADEAESLGFVLVWSNAAFNMWKVPERPVTPWPTP